jgi:hypothetical protein
MYMNFYFEQKYEFFDASLFAKIQFHYYPWITDAIYMLVTVLTYRSRNSSFILLVTTHMPLDASDQHSERPAVTSLKRSRPSEVLKCFIFLQLSDRSFFFPFWHICILQLSKKTVTVSRHAATLRTYMSCSNLLGCSQQASGAMPFFLISFWSCQDPQILVDQAMCIIYENFCPYYVVLMW